MAGRRASSSAASLRRASVRSAYRSRKRTFGFEDQARERVEDPLEPEPPRQVAPVRAQAFHRGDEVGGRTVGRPPDGHEARDARDRPKTRIDRHRPVPVRRPEAIEHGGSEVTVQVEYDHRPSLGDRVHGPVGEERRLPSTGGAEDHGVAAGRD